MLKIFFSFNPIFSAFLILLFSCVFVQGQDTGGIKGRIFNERERPIANVSITARIADKIVKTVTTNNKGEFQLDGLTEGKYDFVFARDGFNSGTIKNVEIRKKKIRNIGNKVLETDESEFVIIKGGVFDKNGFSIYDAKVTIEKVSGGKKFSTQTSESGEFFFRFNEEIATYRVTATFRDKTATKEISVSDAAIYRLALTLDLSIR